MPILNPFIKMVMGILDNSTRARCQIGALKQICRQETQAEEGKQVAQSTAGVDDLKLVGAEIDHVAVEVDGDLKQSDEENSQLRRNELKL